MQTIEITGLTPKIDPATMQITQGMVVSYKRNDKYEQMELGGSTMDIMEMLGVRNFPDAVGKKYEMEVGEDKKLKSMREINDRPVMAGDIERLEAKLNEILGLLRKKEQKQP